jgi:phosphoribosylaminoimidazole carboxylase PurE protein
MNGLDSLLSIVQMPKGIPVATVAIDNATNAALLALRILALCDPSLMSRLEAWKEEVADESRKKTDNLI